MGEPFASRPGRGELCRALYRLGRQHASGVLTIQARLSRGEAFVLRRGSIVLPAVRDVAMAQKMITARLARLVAIEEATATFTGGVAAYPPGAQQQLPLADWVRGHLERQLDGALADRLAHALAGVRLALRPELAPAPADDADRRMLAALAQPRRLDQIGSLARAPRFRLLAFVHFLRSVDALVAVGIVAERGVVDDPRRAAACRMLGVEDEADVEEVKRAYRRLARALHPDLQPDADAERRRALERRFAEVTAAYETLL